MLKVRYLVFGLLLFFLVLISPAIDNNPPTLAQDNDDDCETLMTEALQVVGSTCAEMGRDEACYGHFPITTELSENATGQFETDGDLVDVLEIQTLVTESADPETGAWGVALLLVQADLPEESDAMMTFVLFGDVELSNAGDVEIPAPTCSITNDTANNINIRSGSSTDTEIVETLTAGDNAIATARNEAGDWLQIDYNDTTGWVYQPLISTDCNVNDLDVLSEGQTQPSGRTNAFTLETGQSDTCESIPDGLLVHSPEGRRARVVVNGVEMVFSSVGFLTAQANSEMTVQGIEGQIEVTVGSDTETVTPDFVTSIPLAGLTADGPPSTPVEVDADADTYVATFDAVDTMLDENSIGSRACNATADSDVNLRGGPGTEYNLAGGIDVEGEVTVTGTATGADGSVWWQTSGGWVRSDLVGLAGACENIPDVVPPDPPPPTAASESDGSNVGRSFVMIENSGGHSDIWQNPLCPVPGGGSIGYNVEPGTAGVIIGEPVCGMYEVVLETGQAGWVDILAIQFTD